ncbi:MAG: hypothetical protein MR418_00835 [Clostridiales bacterium]|nr:hypothetical protein [Clostridiales bacterium]
MSLYKLTITSVGTAIINRAISESKKLTFTRAQMGSGLTDDTDLTPRTRLITPVCFTSVDVPSVSERVISLPVMFTNRLDSGFMAAFSFNEIGLWGKLDDTVETLIAYANAGADGDGLQIPGDALTEFTYMARITASGKADISVEAENVSYVSRTYVDTALTQKANNTHSQSASTITEGVLSGRVLANTDAIAALAGRQVRNIIISTDEPTQGVHDGDIWLKYVK